MNYYPERIICLTEEPTEVLYLLGEQDRIIGISAYTVRPKEARKEKPIIGRFIDAKIDEIISLKPDLVIGFSDIQASIAQELIAKGITVWINNYRTVAGIYAMIVQLSSLIGKEKEGVKLVENYQQNIKKICAKNNAQNVKPKVYFEEWYDPLISGITWVSELIEIAGGVDIFSEFKNTSLAKDRIIANPEEVITRNPDIIIASWCGKKFRKEQLIKRKNWDKITAVQNDAIYEIKSEKILQPGPAALSDGIKEMHDIISLWHENQSN